LGRKTDRLHEFMGMKMASRQYENVKMKPDLENVSERLKSRFIKENRSCADNQGGSLIILSDRDLESSWERA